MLLTGCWGRISGRVRSGLLRAARPARWSLCRPGKIVTVPLHEACVNIKTVPIDGQLVRTARDIGISFAAHGNEIDEFGEETR